MRRLPEATLMEKSAVARKLGGAEFIRKLPLCDRLIVNVEIGFSLGRDAAAKKCASRALALLEKKLEPEQLAQFALRYDLSERFPAVIRIAREADRHLDYLLKSAESASDQNIRKREVVSSIRGEISYGNLSLAKIIALEYGIPKSTVSKIASRLCKSKMMGTDYDGAEFLASSFKLPEQRQKARITSITSSIESGKFDAAEKKSKKWGVGHKFMKKLALGVFTSHMEEKEFLRAASVAKQFKLFKEMKKAILCEYNLLKSGKNYLGAARLAKEYHMIAQMHSAAGKIVRAEEKSGSLSAAASRAREFGLERRAQKIAKKMIAVCVKNEDYLGASEIAAKYGLNELRRELLMKAVALEVENGKDYVALGIARSSGLEKEANELAWKFFLKFIHAGEYSRAWKFAEKAGLADAMKILKELEKLVGPRI